MKMMKMFTMLVWIAGLALLISACSFPAVSVPENQLSNTSIIPTYTQPVPTRTPIQETYTPVEPTYTPIVPADTGPAPTYAPIQITEGRIIYEGVSFLLDPAVAAGASGRTVPENPGTPDGPYWEVNPQYVNISLAGYPLAGTFFSPAISIYPVEDYRRLDPRSGETLDDLENLLAEEPAGENQIPFLPVMNAGQVFHSNVQYLDFHNGSGVRFLAIYAQYPAPVNNQDLFYTFQGLTADGRFFVSVILPVNHPSLPADLNALSQSEMEAIAQDPETYYRDMAATLSAWPGDGFKPDLAKLDALIASLAIER